MELETHTVGLLNPSSSPRYVSKEDDLGGPSLDLSFLFSEMGYKNRPRQEPPSEGDKSFSL